MCQLAELFSFDTRNREVYIGIFERLKVLCILTTQSSVILPVPSSRSLIWYELHIINLNTTFFQLLIANIRTCT
jgi:hypothetical protein